MNDLIIKNIRTLSEEYLSKYDLKSVILGVSGGIDSALVALLIRPVCDVLGINLYGYSLPIESNKKNEIERAKKIGKICHVFKERNLTDLYHQIISYETIDEEANYISKIKNKIRKGNIKARIRMIFLYDRAYQHKGLVLSTDNLSEYYLGFWTLHGDVGDLGIIQGLWKTEVYRISEYLLNKEVEKYGPVFKKGFSDCIKAIPTDGLGISDSDLEQLGVKSYLEVDKNLLKYICEDKNINKKIYERINNTAFKRNNPKNFMRSDIGLYTPNIFL